MSILVIGDVMADVYIEGVVNRISPEAPVPIFLEKTQRMFPGGAANVARNIMSLGGEACTLLGVAGHDTLGTDLNETMLNNGIGSRLIMASDRPTTRKTRYVANGQQILRVDDESTASINAETAKNILDAATPLLSRISVLVISDYGKGVVTDDLMSKLQQQADIEGVFTIVDPKGTDWSKYTSVNMIKPNADELSKATGMPTGTKEECCIAAIQVARAWDISYVLVTRADKGMILCRHGGECFTEPATAREVYDVVGAGDTALAAMAVGMSKNYSVAQAMRFANKAAGIAVSRHGTTAVTLKEVEDAFIGA